MAAADVLQKSEPAIERGPGRQGLRFALAVAPLAVLALVLAFALGAGPALPGQKVPVEEVTIERVRLHEGVLELKLRNTGPAQVTLAQGIVNDVLWPFDADPGPVLSRFGSATVSFQYPWIEAEPLHVTLVSSQAFKFETEVAAAVETPQFTPATFGTLALVGAYVGLIPVMAGLLWRPLVARLPESRLHAILGFTVGLLAFLALDSFGEAREAAEAFPGAFKGEILVIGGVVATALGLYAVARALSAGAGAGVALAGLIALGIGLHNFGEGLAVGGAFALGEAALGAFLVVGFALHNTTEGLAIVAPLGDRRVRIGLLLGLGALAGAPTILGAWIGGSSPSIYLSVLFLAVGAGAILEVIYEIHRGTAGGIWKPAGIAGILLGLAVMYVTGLLVVI